MRMINENHGIPQKELPARFGISWNVSALVRLWRREDSLDERGTVRLRGGVCILHELGFRGTRHEPRTGRCVESARVHEDSYRLLFFGSYRQKGGTKPVW
ncbi:MAG: hypothetical protein Q8O41_08215 [Candidatus Methanoperedens sp.]|nr:hypothetical protein [Candidatus Methanoperedens sp.]